MTEATIFHGGPIHTMDPALGRVEALGISDGRVIAAGLLEHVKRTLGNDAGFVDLDGRTVLPGLIDTHPHLLHYGTLQEPLVDITAANSHVEIIERIRVRAASTKPGEWIMTTPVGEPHYFITRSWKNLIEGRLPNRHELDRASTNHPVMIQAWAPVTPNVIAFNSEALRRLGIDENTPSQIGEVSIEKDTSGKPTGILSGSVTNYYSLDSFNHSIWRKIPFLQMDKMRPGTIRGMKHYNAQGVTGIYENHMMDPPLIDVYRSLRTENQLTLRVMIAQEAESYGMPWSKPRSRSDFVLRCEEAAERIELKDEFLRFNGMTFMRDGTCWPGALRMREPYRGPYGAMTNGIEYISKERAALAMKICAGCGMRLNTISMGSHAHEENLFQLEAMAPEFDIPSLHWILVHAFFVEPEQARRYAKLGMDVTTTMSFTWGKGELFRERMKGSVLSDLIPLRRLLDNGLVVAGGSDWGPKNAFKQIELALTHEFGGSSSRNRGPAQQISREEALAMWTRDAARVLRWNDIGSLNAGNHADLIVIDRDPMSCEIEAIGKTEVLATLVGGRVVHGALPELN
ncbi:MAG: amidohydrolase family protein [Afipia sp.]|nr:amidohydrolase family protein [Afipia sp.]